MKNKRWLHEGCRYSFELKFQCIRNFACKVTKIWKPFMSFWDKAIIRKTAKEMNVTATDIFEACKAFSAWTFYHDWWMAF